MNLQMDTFSQVINTVSIIEMNPFILLFGVIIGGLFLYKINQEIITVNETPVMQVETIQLQNVMDSTGGGGAASPPY